MIEREIAYPVEPYQIYLGFIIISGIFLVLYYLQKMKKQASYQQKHFNKNTGTRYHFNPAAMSSSQQKSQPHANTKINNNSPMRVTKMQEQKSQQKINQKQFIIREEREIWKQQREIKRINEQKAKDPKQTFKQLSNLANNYSKNEHLIQKIFRSEEQIQKQRQIYIIRKQKPQEQKETLKRPILESKEKESKKQKQQREKIKKMNLIQKQYEKGLKDTSHIIENPKNKNKDDEMNNIQNPYSGQNPNNSKKQLPSSSINVQSNKLFSFDNPKITTKTEENKKTVTPTQNKPQPTPSTPLNIFQNLNSMNVKVGEIAQKNPVQPQSSQLKKPLKNAQEIVNNKNPVVPQTTKTTTPVNNTINSMPITKQQPKPPVQVQAQQEKQKEKQKEIKKGLTIIIQQSQRQDSSKNQMKIQTATDYIDAISKYSQTFKLKTQIATNISNLSGAVSDPRQLWLFASTYIKTIDTNNHDQAVTFSFRIWQAIVYKFIKNTNVKDGFEKMPPKQRNRQVQKNSINKYILLLNIYRVMGHQAIWLGAFGKTLKMIEFIYKRKDPIKKWEKLQLIENRYIPLDGDLNAKYLSRIDFLTYFLLGLATFDPISVFEEVSQKTGEVYPFIQELKKYKHKWSYRQFWCLVQTIKSNKFDGYFKIPFWNNTLTAIYLPLLKNMKQGSMKEFVNLSKWINKQVKQQTKKFEKTPEAEFLRKEQYESSGGEYQFDGDQFVSSIIGMGREMDFRERRMRSLKWQDFRNQYSIFYYFWRLDT